MAVDIRPLDLSHVDALVELHVTSPPEYSQYFTPFPCDAETFRCLLERKRRDQYFVVLLDGRVAGFYMLRGLDEGFSVPAYGVWIAAQYSGRGLALATLTHAMEASRALGCERLMLKVHPENGRARAMYERFGFQQTGVDPRNQNLVYHLQL